MRMRITRYLRYARYPKLVLTTALALSLIPINLIGQPSQQAPQSYQFFASAPPSVTSGSGNVTGNLGSTTYYYWIIAKYAIGNSSAYGPIIVRNAPSRTTGSNYVTVSWNTPASSVSGYDVIRLSGTAVPPLPASCTNCLIASDTSLTILKDDGQSLSNYTVTTIGSAQGNIFLNNSNYGVPTMVFDGGTNSWLFTGSVSCTGTPCGTPSSPNAVYNNQANTGTAAFTLDASASTVSNAFKVPAQANLTVGVAGATGEDTTATMYHNYTGGVDSLQMTVPKSASITNGHCTDFSVSGSVITLADAGAACGSGGGGGIPSPPYITYSGNYYCGNPIRQCYPPSGLSWFNQPTSATVTNDNGAEIMTTPANSASQSYRGSSISTTYLDIRLSIMGAGANFLNCGVFFYNSSTGETMTFGPGSNSSVLSNVTQSYLIYTQSSLTGGGTNTQFAYLWYTLTEPWIELKIDSTNIYFYLLPGGSTATPWLFYSQSKTASPFTGGAPNQWGYFCGSTSVEPGIVELLSYNPHN